MMPTPDPNAGQPRAATDGDAPESGQKRKGFFRRLRERLNQGDSWLTYDLAHLLPGGKVGEEFIEEMETRLLTGDVGVDATSQIVSGLERKLWRDELGDSRAVIDTIRREMLEILTPCEAPLEIPPDIRPFVVLVVGVNGAGKTTTIGKIAHKLKADGRSVMLAAGDTFRAAAVEQLQTWGARNDVPVIAQHTGADPAAVVYDAFEAARARRVDVLLADTAGRLHTQENLMDELRKVKRVLGRLDADAPHEVLLVLDGGSGQNALLQARRFNEAVGVTGIAITKLDGSAKGGIVLAIARELGLPMRFIGIGESIEDLAPFEAGPFVDALLAAPAPGAPR
ncbi:signal recognition particle-docking protein FtsY [Wenzhouxiangella sp. XN24]|uniref:signal recognition particle-docking protein FtsY n=1 Tax=Wenzhouxiangella sp. XN24 TaxID=2713569 RepID=UPI0013E9AF59|nr:signal recognition particle-docking protein FtsY [Wenzhouxiangella sp. XN24]NGX17617.1 signal recognition particle-docking protein FtsY [Wenzhouxiangella sp. XN24]